MKIQTRDHVAAMSAFLASVGLAFNPKSKYTSKAYYDCIEIPTAADTMVTALDGATSSEKLHPRGIHGCNLPNPGRLPGNSRFIITELWAEPLQSSGVSSSAKFQDFLSLSSYGLLRQFFVEDVLVLDERPLNQLWRRSSGAPITSGEGAGAAVLYGPAPYANGLQLPPDARIVVPPEKRVKATFSHNANVLPSTAGGGVALSAVFPVKFHIVGVEEEIGGA